MQGKERRSLLSSISTGTDIGIHSPAAKFHLLNKSKQRERQRNRSSFPSIKPQHTSNTKNVPIPLRSIASTTIRCIQEDSSAFPSLTRLSVDRSRRSSECPILLHHFPRLTEVTVLRRTEAEQEFCFFACNTERGLIVLEEVLHLATRRVLRVIEWGEKEGLGKQCQS